MCFLASAFWRPPVRLSLWPRHSIFGSHRSNGGCFHCHIASPLSSGCPLMKTLELHPDYPGYTPGSRSVTRSSLQMLFGPCKVTQAHVLGIRVWTSLGKRLACCIHLVQNWESCEFGTGSQPRAPCSHRGSEQRRVSRRKGARQWHRWPREEPRWDAGPAPDASMSMGLPSAAPLPGLELAQVGSCFLQPNCPQPEQLSGTQNIFVSVFCVSFCPRDASALTDSWCEGPSPRATWIRPLLPSLACLIGAVDPVPSE